MALGLSATLVGTLFPVYWNVTRGALLAHEQSLGTMLAAQRLEQLRALAFAFDDTPLVQRASPTSTTDLSGATPSQDGAGLATSPAGTLLVPTRGYVDYLDAQGRWLGNDVGPPPGAAFVRRWAVTPSLGFPMDGVLLQVVVSPWPKNSAPGRAPMQLVGLETSGSASSEAGVCDGSRGFSLLECLVALALLCLVVAGMVSAW